MTKLGELKAAYERFSKECSFYCTDVIPDINEDGERWQLVFTFFGVGIRMSFSYEFIIGNDPFADDIVFTGDPCLHFSMYCYDILMIFIAKLQEYRTNQDVMDEFIDYLKEKKIHLMEFEHDKLS
jgi:hypothetical protein